MEISIYPCSVTTTATINLFPADSLVNHPMTHTYFSHFFLFVLHLVKDDHFIIANSWPLNCDIHSLQALASANLKKKELSNFGRTLIDHSVHMVTVPGTLFILRPLCVCFRREKIV